MISCAKLTLNYDVNAIRGELALLQHSWSPHFNTHYYEGGWSVLPLRSAGGGIDAIYGDAINNKPFADTSLMKNFPSVQQLLNNLHCSTMSVRFLKLKAHSFIKEHRDTELAFENGEARIHFPIITNNLVEFYLDNELVKMNEGECWYINANLPHKVNNNSNEDRTHLVIDCKVNDWLLELFNQSEKRTKDVVINDIELKKIIAELRLQNTQVSLQLADDLCKQLTQTSDKQS